MVVNHLPFAGRTYREGGLELRQPYLLGSDLGADTPSIGPKPQISHWHQVYSDAGERACKYLSTVHRRNIYI
jgi:hypothetical protein